MTPEQEQLRQIAKKMGDAGYCNYDACMEYLTEAYQAGRREENERQSLERMQADNERLDRLLKLTDEIRARLMKNE